MPTSADKDAPTLGFWSLCRKFVWQRFFFVAVASYMLFSMLLMAATDIDICIPCLWRTVFGFRCPGCGLTHAGISLVRLDVMGAWEANPLVFVVLPAGMLFIYLDVKRFLDQERATGITASLDRSHS